MLCPHAPVITGKVMQKMLLNYSPHSAKAIVLGGTQNSRYFHFIQSSRKQ